MIAHTKCPFCNSPLLNEDTSIKFVKNLWRKSCLFKLDHKFIEICKQSDDKVYLIQIKIENNLTAYWFFDSKKVAVVDCNISLLPQRNKLKEIPWFEPDLSDYKHLVLKIKKYLLFS
jgi:hypothetical protein